MDIKKELNEKQYEAVTNSSQYLRIIAGAGSGKTRVLTYRISYLIKEMHVFPSSILAITFTNKVAKEMALRASKLISEDTPIRLNIFTFHGFCARFLRSEIDALGITKNFVILDEEDKDKIIKNLLSEKGYKKTDPLYEDINSFIDFHKSRGELPSDFSIDENNPKAKLLYEFFFDYEEIKRNMFALDFDDLLIYAIKILSSFPDIRNKYISRYRHILIDEFQDTNNVQYTLLKLLSGPDTNIYIVGDPDQTIYTWRGADQRIILDIEHDFYPMKTIILNQNYRSTQYILDHANKLISYNKERVKKELFTDRLSKNDVELHTFFDNQLEANFVSRKIKELMFNDKTLEYKDICILYRSSYLSLPIEKSFARDNIPYTVYGGMKFYSRKEVKDCLAYFRLIVNSKDDVSFERIINVPRRKIGEKTILILKNEAKNHNLSMMDYVKDIDKYDSEIKPSTLVSLLTLVKKIDELKAELDTNYDTFDLSLSRFLEEIGYFNYLMDNDEDGDDRINNVRALLDDVKAFLKENPESKFIDYLNNISLLSGQDDIKNTDSVSLMTVHTAKGLEFRIVFVVSLCQFIFPNNRAMMERKGGLEEERRLCYVAFTRAKDRLFVSYNRSYNYSTQSSNIASQFIEEAKLKPSETATKTNIYNNSILYSYKTNNSFNEPRHIVDQNKNVFCVNDNKTNNIKWNVGDTCIHDTFKVGKVIKVEGDIITVDFESVGVKKLLGNHFKLKKKD